MSGLLNVGFGNMINSTKLVAVINPDSAPAKRLVQTSRDEGRVVDATQGRRTRAVLIMDDDHVVLSFHIVHSLSLDVVWIKYIKN